LACKADVCLPHLAPQKLRKACNPGSAPFSSQKRKSGTLPEKENKKQGRPKNEKNAPAFFEVKLPVGAFFGEGMGKAIAHVAITVSSLRRAKRFYALLGFKEKKRFTRKDMRAKAVWLEKEGDIIELWEFEKTKVRPPELLSKRASASG
jgi:hypothetical protein